MSLIRKLCYAFLAIVILLFLLLTFTLTTKPGMHFAFYLAERVVPGLTILNIKGNWHNLSVVGVEYQHEGISFKSGLIKLSFKPSCLLKSKLCINEFSVHDTLININTNAFSSSSPPSNRTHNTDFYLRYPIVIKQVLLDSIIVNVDGINFKLDHFLSAMSLENHQLTVQSPQINSLLISNDHTKDEITQNSGSINEQLAHVFSTPLLSSLPDVFMPFDIKIINFKGENIEYLPQPLTRINQFVFNGGIKNNEVNISQFDVAQALGTFSLKGEGKLQQDWPVHLSVHGKMDWPILANEKVALKIDGELNKQLQVSARLNGNINSTVDAHVQLAETALPFSLNVKSKQLTLPLTTSEIPYQLSNLSLAAKGNVNHYNLQVASDIKGGEIPAANIVVTGNGSLTGFNVVSAKIKTLQGIIGVKGSVNWQNRLNWQAMLTAKNINAIKQWQALPFTIDGKLTTQGYYDVDNWSIALSDMNLLGTINRQKLNLTGMIQGDNKGVWLFNQLRLSLGKNHLFVDGQLGEKWFMDANIDAPNLEGILPELGGKIVGKVSLRGSIRKPQVTTELHASHLQFQNYKVKKIDLQGTVNPFSNINSQFSLLLDSLHSEQLSIDKLNLTANGTEKKHQIALVLAGEPISGSWLISGGYDENKALWQGELTKGSIDTPLGKWVLTKSLALTYGVDTQKLVLGSHCWLNSHAKICLPHAANIGQQGKVDIVLSQLDLALFKPYLPYQIKTTGIITGELNLAWQNTTQLPKAHLSLSSEQLQLGQKVDDKFVSVTFSPVKLNGSINGDSGRLDWLVQLANNGKTTGNIVINHLRDKRDLSGNIIVDGLSLNLLQPLLQANEHIAGVVSSHLQLKGSLNDPLLYGKIDVNQFKLNGDLIPIVILDSQLAMSFDGNHSKLQGEIKTPEGPLMLTGNALWQDSEKWQVELGINGKNIKVMVPPFANFLVSPQLTFRAVPNKLFLNGNIDIPKGKITIDDMPSNVVDVSSDEVMLDDNLRVVKKKAKTPLSIYSQLFIKLGNDVALDAFGLKTNLKGQLKVVQNEGDLGLNGSIDLVKGRFRAYGQDLLINKGHLIFSGSPYQPLLNIEAVRNPKAIQGNVRVGVKVTGSADKPNLTIFSVPAMSQEEALSYLIRGQGLSSSKDDSGMMASMLIGLGVAKSGKLVGKFGNMFGVSDLSLDTEGVGQNSQVVLSGYLWPGLRVKYGVGLFDSLATLTLRYQLLPKLYLEAASGLSQSIDLLYHFEFN